MADTQGNPKHGRIWVKVINHFGDEGLPVGGLLPADDAVPFHGMGAAAAKLLSEPMQRLTCDPAIYTPHELLTTTKAARR